MDHVVDPIPVPTEMIRTPATGPAPANTLAFLRCRGSGADIQIGVEQIVKFEVEFKSKFKIDGYQQQKHDWYLQNTKISATGVVRLLNTITDLEFLFAMDTVDPFIDLDGVIGFNCQVGLQIDGVGFFVREPVIDFSFNVSAYVLLYEPRVDLPPSGSTRQPWRYDPNEYALQKVYPSGTIRSVGDLPGMALRLRRSAVYGTDNKGATGGNRKKDYRRKDKCGTNDDNCP
jgi:hypothetical protein